MNALPEELRSIPALSIRQPWAWAILHAGKDFENRDWSTRYRGPLLIHASKSCGKEEYEDACDFIHRCCPTIEIPALSDLLRGGIVGRCKLTECFNSNVMVSPWFLGRFGFYLAAVEELPFIPCKGRLGFFYPK